MPEYKNKVKSVIKNIKSEYIFIALAVVLIAYFALSGLLKDKKRDDGGYTNIEVTDADSYCLYLESKIKKCLENIDGVGKADVTVTVDGEIEEVYATEKVTVETSQGNKITESVVMVSGKPLLIKEIYPYINGIVVVADGGNNPAVKVKIIDAITTCVEVDCTQILILKRK